VIMDQSVQTYCPVHKSMCPSNCPYRKPLPLTGVGCGC
jgi:hypothetical protein